jgi:hypothetical protein
MTTKPERLSTRCVKYQVITVVNAGLLASHAFSAMTVRPNGYEAQTHWTEGRAVYIRAARAGFRLYRLNQPREGKFSRRHGVAEQGSLALVYALISFKKESCLAFIGNDAGEERSRAIAIVARSWQRSLATPFS